MRLTRRELFEVRRSVAYGILDRMGPLTNGDLARLLAIDKRRARSALLDLENVGLASSVEIGKFRIWSAREFNVMFG